MAQTQRLFLSRRGLLACGCALGAAASLGLKSQTAHAQEASQSVIRDTEIESFLKNRTRTIFEAAGLVPENVHFYLIADDTLNAWASLGLRLGLHTGLIEECENPNQLFGVIAHEAGHLAGGHALRTDEIYRAGRAPMAIALGLGIVAALAGSSEGAAYLFGSSQTFGQMNMLRYLQSQEAAADAAAVKFLEKANMSGKGLVDFFYKFRNYEIFSNAEKYAFFRTHPLSRDRIQLLDKVVKSQPHYTATDPQDVVEEFNIARAKLLGFLGNPITVYKKYPLTDTSYAARYARVIADYKRSDWDKAIADLDGLIQENPNNPYLFELKGQIYFETGRSKLAKPEFLKSVELKPDAPLLRLNLAQALLNTGDKNDLPLAITHLQVAQSFEQDSFSWSLTAQAYDSMGDQGMARLATAESQFFAGDFMAARESAVWSQKYFDKSSAPYRRARDIVLATSNYLGIEAVEDETEGRRPRR